MDNEIKYDALTSDVTADQIRQYRRERKRDSVWGKYIGGFAIAIFALAGIVSIVYGFSSGDTGQGVLGAIMTGLGLLVCFILVIATKHADILAIRLERFAEQNGLIYSRGPVRVGHQGVIFQVGDSRRADNVVTRVDRARGLLFEIGDYRYTPGSGKNRHTSYWTYFCVELDRHVPHMLLDATSNNISLFGKTIMSNLPATFKKDQVLSLEGDFNKHFTLYAPQEYKQDAYYIFTPDLMALLIDNAHALDAETIDNKVFFYTPRSGSNSSFTNIDTLQGIVKIIQTVGASMHRRTDYYADENVANRAIDIVATEGRRLKQGVNWIIIVIVVLIFAVNMLMIFS